MSDYFPAPKWKVVEEDFPGIGKCYRHAVKWFSYDGRNMPQAHHVVGPIFRERGGIDEEGSLQTFSEMLHKQLLKFPTCDEMAVKAELAKRKQSQ